MTPRLPAETASVVLALRQLAMAICAARPDGADILASLQRGTCRIVFDEREGLIAIGIKPDAGGLVTWLETVLCNPANEDRFGELLTQRAAFEESESRGQQLHAFAPPGAMTH